MLHPIFGPDHLLAMVTVGIISSKIGGKAVWAVPSMFVLALIMGSIAGTLYKKFPLMEEGIALSVLLPGIGVFFRGEKNHPLLTLFVVGIFGLYHGNAHGSLILSSKNL